MKLSVSEASKLTVVVARQLPGKRKGRSCLKATKKLAKARKCTRSVKAGTLTRALKAGPATIAFSGRFGRKALAPGTYTATLRAADAAGNRSKVVVLTFTVVG